MIPNSSIIFTVDDVERRLDFRKVPLMVWEQLASNLNLTSSTLVQGLLSDDVRAVMALVWLERKQHDRRAKYNEVRKELLRDEPDIALVDLLVDGKSVIVPDDDDDGGDSDEGEFDTAPGLDEDLEETAGPSGGSS